MIVKLDNIVKRYKDLVALDHFSLEVEKGEIYGLLGPNGSGKSTAINCMLSLLKFDFGTVEIFGEEMAPNRYDIKKRIGLVMQNIGVYDELTVIENIDYFCSLYIDDHKIRQQYVNEALDFVELNEFKKFYPKKLSGGLLRRLNLACGIAHKPELIILDEPTVAVDPQSRNKILEGIKNLRDQGKTIIYTTHYMEEVEQLCDRLTIMDRGKVLITGNSQQIKAMSTVGEVVRVETFDVTDTLLEEVGQLSDIQDVQYKPGELTIRFSKGDNHVLPMIHLLESHQINILNLSVQKPTLNDVFLEITGKELRDHG